MTDAPFERLAFSTEPQALLFVCDHASNALPPSYGTLGLDRHAFETHIASDIGAAQVTRVLARTFGATAILARWSRLLIDLNRGADDPTLVMKLSDGRIIPGNRDADAAEVTHRLAQFHAPYHAAIADEIARAKGRPCAGDRLDAQFHTGVERCEAPLGCRRSLGQGCAIGTAADARAHARGLHRRRQRTL